MAFTPRSPNVALNRRWLCRGPARRCWAAWQQSRRDSAIVTSSVSPRQVHGLTENLLLQSGEAAIERWKQVIGDGLRSRMDERRVTEVNVAVHALNRMLTLGRPSYVRIV